MPKPQETEEVRFGGTWTGILGQRPPARVHEGYTAVLAIPCDMEIAGYGPTM